MRKIKGESQTDEGEREMETNVRKKEGNGD